MKMKTYFGVSALATFARVLPQAVLTPILLAKDLQYDSIIWTQIVYMVTLTLAEFPSGTLADRFSRKKLYVLSILVFGCAYGVVWFGEGLIIMCVAWAIYALGTALNSSTMDIHFATILRDDERSFKRFFALDHNVVLAATIVSAVATTTLYPLFGAGLYALSIGCFMIAAVYGALALPKTPIVRDTDDDDPPKVIESLRRDPWLIFVILLFALTQLAFTPFFQMWQMVFLDADLDAGWFGPIFIAFQLINIGANAIWARLAHRQRFSFALLAAILAIGVGVLVSDGIWTVLLVVIIPFPLFLYANSLAFSLQSRAPAALMSSMNALMGTASTVGALATLVLCLVGLQITTPGVFLSSSLIVFAVVSAGLLAIAIAQRLTAASDSNALHPVSEAAN
ncbi:MFS transporter [Microbacterium sp. NEAU-LLB]|uniref:MFS transporter n=2 Tax=Microbacterium stercoris TaxID=2820289 RepID=A0A939QJA1_9MICO|nr:MFS transporter [Microbacterium stercoris]